MVLLPVTFGDKVGEYNGRRRRRRGLLHVGERESDILRTPHEGKPLGPAQPTEEDDINFLSEDQRLQMKFIPDAQKSTQ